MSDQNQKNPVEKEQIKQAQHDANRDPLSGRAGAHPVGTGVGALAGGAAAGAAAGAAVGTVAGPVGTAAGAVAGAVVGAVGGGFAGKGIAEAVNPTVEHGYWQQNFASRPYIQPGSSYQDYGPAYQYGWECQARSGGKSFEESESALRRDWDKAKGTSKLEWDRAKEAVHDSWNRVAHRNRPSSGGRAAP